MKRYYLTSKWRFRTLTIMKKKISKTPNIFFSFHSSDGRSSHLVETPRKERINPTVGYFLTGNNVQRIVLQDWKFVFFLKRKNIRGPVYSFRLISHCVNYCRKDDKNDILVCRLKVDFWCKVINRMKTRMHLSAR